MMNKRGVTTVRLFTFMAVILVGIIFLAVYGLVFYYINDSLTNNIAVGNVTLNSVRASTFGQLTNAFLTNVDLLGMGLIFGMVIAMGINAYALRGKWPKIFIIFDIFILFFVYLMSVYLSNTYETLINASSYLNIFTERLSNSSTFILKLPIITPIVGVIIMILSYSGIPKQEDEIPTLK